MDTTPPSGSERLLTVQQFADYLQVDPQTVWGHVRKGAWPHVRLGPRTIRFTAEHVAQIIALASKAPAETARTRRRRRIPS